MLHTITLKNVALAKQTEVSFDQGFNVITGETGAGKSLLLDAVNLCIGARSDSGLVRHGADKAEVYAEFVLDTAPTQQQAVQDWCNAHDIDINLAAEPELLIRRQIQANGRSKAWLNGMPVSSGQLKTLGQHLVQMHSQHAQHELLKPAFVVSWLDSLANTDGLRVDMQTTWKHYAKLKTQVDSAEADSAARQDKIMLLSSKVADVAEVIELDYTELEQEHETISNFESVMQDAGQALMLLDESDSSISSALSQAARLCDGQTASPFAAASEHLHTALSDVTEAISQLRQFADQDAPDVHRLAELDRQLADFHRLARKYNVKPAELKSLHTDWSEELYQLESLSDPSSMDAKLAEAKAAFLAAAEALDTARKQAAPKLEQTLADKLNPLALPHAAFEFVFEPVEDFNDSPSAGGLSTIQLLFSANTGTPKQPLHKTASGGELSRIALVMQVMNASLQDNALMVFDEVDVGISGGTAQILGQLLREMGSNQQILAITHQAQVAAQGHHHLLVEKEQRADETESYISIISDDARIDELARMSGGTDISEATREHAKTLLAAVVE